MWGVVVNVVKKFELGGMLIIGGVMNLVNVKCGCVIVYGDDIFYLFYYGDYYF